MAIDNEQGDPENGIQTAGRTFRQLPEDLHIDLQSGFKTKFKSEDCSIEEAMARHFKFMLPKQIPTGFSWDRRAHVYLLTSAPRVKLVWKDQEESDRFFSLQVTRRHQDDTPLSGIVPVDVGGLEKIIIRNSEAAIATQTITNNRDNETVVNQTKILYLLLDQVSYEIVSYDNSLTIDEMIEIANSLE